MHNVSIVHTDSTSLQEAITNNAHKDTIVKLKSRLAFNCVTGFESYKVSFSDLGNLLSADVGFIPFKLKDSTTAIYNKEKHPNAAGGIRGVSNIDSKCSWLCYDVDDSSITDTEMHSILSSINHHIARTSDVTNQYKMRIMVELSTPIAVTREEWKPFITSIATTLGIHRIDKLAQSHITFGYKNREVMSQVNGEKIDPSTHLKMARMKVAELEEKNASSLSPDQRSDALDRPLSTFKFAFEAQEGDRWRTAHAAIHKAKELGASREYIIDLMYKINDFLDEPKSKEIVEASLFSAI